MMQLYANSSNPQIEEYHRMLYVFSCLSTQCINTQRAVKVYRALIKHNNPFVKFADDAQFNFVSEAIDQELLKKGLIKAEQS